MAMVTRMAFFFSADVLVVGAQGIGYEAGQPPGHRAPIEARTPCDLLGLGSPGHRRRGGGHRRRRAWCSVYHTVAHQGGEMTHTVIDDHHRGALVLVGEE